MTRRTIAHWQACMGVELAPWFCRLLRRLSVEFVTESQNAREAQWLTKPLPDRQFFYEDTWGEVCRTRFFHSLSALCDLAKEGVWPAGRWREALQAWAEEGVALRSWRYAAPLVQTMPDTVLLEIDHAVTRWMECASKSINCHEDTLLSLCRRILAFPLEVGSGSGIIRNGIEAYDPVASAIGHPIATASSGCSAN